MGTTIRPVFFKTEETETLPADLAGLIRKQCGDDAAYLLDYPTIYIHIWRSEEDRARGRYSLYIGESNDVVRRTCQHYDAAGRLRSGKRPDLEAEEDGGEEARRAKEGWQAHLLEAGTDPVLYVIGHKRFNKSLTLDLENRLYDYCFAMESAVLHNGRGNPQRRYCGEEDLDDIFSMIWRRLRADCGALFLPETSIRKSALYKASPNHKLTDEQHEAQVKILKCVEEAVREDKTGQLIFVEGEAGTGKTVLSSSTFYDLLDRQERKRCYLLVNHDEQLGVYQDMARKLGFPHRFGEIVFKPTSFINKVRSGELAPPDVVFIDETHLLWTQGKQAYTGKNQLDDILSLARVTVAMFDANQILRTEEYWEAEQLRRKRELSRAQGNFIELRNQLRMNCSAETMAWVDGVTKDGRIDPLPRDDDYEIRVFETPEALQQAIGKRAAKDETSLSRLIATYDWPYSRDKKPEKEEYWEVRIGGWHLPWNRETLRELTPQERRRAERFAWAEQAHTVGEVGSTFTIQGFDLAYAGVIIGRSVGFVGGRLVFRPEEKAYDHMTDKRTMSDGEKVSVAQELLRNELRVLMTRGTQGLYLYAEDPELRRALLDAAKQGRDLKTKA